MDVLLNAMAAEPEDRPTAAQFRDQLSALNLTTKLAPRPLEATPESPSPPRSPEKPVAVKVVEPAAEKERRWEHRGLVALAIAAAVVAVVAAINPREPFSRWIRRPLCRLRRSLSLPTWPLQHRRRSSCHRDSSTALSSSARTPTAQRAWSAGGASRGSPTSRRLGPRQNVTSCTCIRPLLPAAFPTTSADNLNWTPMRTSGASAPTRS